MKRIFHLIIISSSFLTTLFIAASCDDELDTDGTAPVFKVNFTNQTAINTLTPLITDLTEEITDISDSLSVIDSLINAGDTRDFTDNIATLTDTRTDLVDERTSAQSMLTNAQNGSVRIDALIGADNEPPRLYEDSLSSYVFPLDAGANNSTFSISLGGIVYTLETAYDLDTILTERSVIFEAFNFEVVATSFDSAQVVCDDVVNCTSNETTVTLFF